MPEKMYGLKLNVPDDNTTDNENILQFSEKYLEKQIRSKRKLNFELDENSTENQKKLIVIRYEALKLKYTKDTNTALLTTLGDGCNYSDFVELINICKYDGHKMFATWKNKFVIFNYVTPKKDIIDTNIVLCGFSCSVYVVKKSPPHFLKKIKPLAKLIYKTGGFAIFIGWVFILLCYWYFRKRNKAI